MSQLRQESLPSAGKSKFDKLAWSDFVQHVLELTVKAYQAMYQDRTAQSDWEEDKFTACLGENYLYHIVRDNDSPILITIQRPVYKPQMKEGKQSSSEAKRIDLSLGNWEQNYFNKYFAWEAKRVGDKRVYKKYGDLNSKYVNEGIYRFIRKQYADGLSDAGMLGYILAGSVANIVGDINLSMGRIRKNPPLSESNHLRLAQPIDNFENVYRSHHTRTDDTKISLHHLFLKFEFNF